MIHGERCSNSKVLHEQRPILWVMSYNTLLIFNFTFAMAAPRSIKFDQDKFIISDGSLKVIHGEDKDPLLLLDLGLGHGPKNR